MNKKNKLFIILASAIIIYLIITVFIVPVLREKVVVKEKFLSEMSAIMGSKEIITSANMAMEIFPYPIYIFTDLRVKNNPGFVAENFIEAPQMQVKPSFISLLLFSNHASEFKIKEALINIEFNNEGEPNLISSAKQEKKFEAAPFGVTLLFEGGKIIQTAKDEGEVPTSTVPGQAQKIEDETLIKHLSFAASSSITLEGVIVSGGYDIEIFSKISDIDNQKKTANVKLDIEFLDGKFSFEGPLSGFEKNFKLTGKYEVLAEKPFEGLVENYFAKNYLVKNSVIDKKIELRGDIALSLNEITSTNSEIKIGDWAGKAEIKGKFTDEQNNFSVIANIKTIDLSELLRFPEASELAANTQAQTTAENIIDTAPEPAEKNVVETVSEPAEVSKNQTGVLGNKPAKDYSAIMPDNINFVTTINIDEIIFRDKKFFNVSLTFGLENEIAGIRNFSLPLPGNGTLSLNADFSDFPTFSGNESRIDGQVSLFTDNFTESISPFAELLPRIASVKLGNVMGSANFAIMPGKLYITKIDSDIEGGALKGELLFDGSSKREYEIKLNGRKIDYDKFSSLFGVQEFLDYAVKDAPGTNETTSFYDRLREINYKFKGEFSFDESKLNNAIYEKLAFSIDIFPGNLVVKDMKLKSEKIDLQSGNFFLNTVRLKPIIINKLEFKYLDISGFLLSPEYFKQYNKNEPMPESIWNANRFNFAGIETFDSIFNIAAETLKFGQVKFDNAKIDGNITDRVINITSFKSGFYGGTADARFSMFAAGNITGSISATLANANLAEMQTGIFGKEQTLGGKFNLTATGQFLGESFKDWVKGFSGSGNVIVKTMDITKANFLYMTNRIEKVVTLEDYDSMIARSFSEGRTKLDDFAGDFTIAEGKAELKNAKVTSAIKLQVGSNKNLIDDGNLRFFIDLNNSAFESKMRLNINSRSQWRANEVFLNFTGALDGNKAEWDSSSYKKEWEERSLLNIQNSAQ